MRRAFITSLSIALTIGALAGTLHAQFSISASGRITGGTCTTQFARAVSVTGGVTCEAITAADLGTTLAVTFATVDTGQGANELYDMDQNVLTTSAVTFVTLDTGQGANELYDMDQNVLTTSTPQFARLGLGAAAYAAKPLVLTALYDATTYLGQFVVDGSAGTHAYASLVAAAGSDAGVAFYDGSTRLWSIAKENQDLGLRRNSGTGNLIIPAGTVTITAGLIDADGYQNNGVVMVSVTAPTIASGFGTSPSVTASNGTAAFTVNVGTGGTASAGVVTMPAATTGWACQVENVTGVAANRADQRTVQTATTTTSVTVQNQTISTGGALAWTASDVLRLACLAY